MKNIPFIFLLLASSSSLAEESRGVPEELFGIKLGGIYDIGDSESKDNGNIPIRKFAGILHFLGNGIHYYFQPKKEYKAFEYVEKRENPDDQYFKSSFRLYLLPVIPPEIKTIEQLGGAKTNWEVTIIEWSNDAKTKKDAYYWAIDLCKTFGIDISIEPEIIDYYEKDWYECTFSSDDRVFEVSSLYSRSIKLSYKEEVDEAKNDALERTIRKIKAKEIRPY